jgi:hypothetical protein
MVARRAGARKCKAGEGGRTAPHPAYKNVGNSVDHERMNDAARHQLWVGVPPPAAVPAAADPLPTGDDWQSRTACS